jgi:L-ascorbate metabolism protein UlaG (beta-lactamase superfamily)
VAVGITVDFVGHASALIEIDGVRVLTDPVLRSHVTFLRRVVPAVSTQSYRDVDVVLISHLHHDHCDIASLSSLRDAIVVAPNGAAAYLRTRARLPHVLELPVGQTTSVAGLVITSVFADHDGGRPMAAVSAQAAGYVITGAEGTVYFAGDTDLYDGMRNLPMPESGGLDLALLPVWGWGPNLGPGHMDPGRAAQAAQLLNPRAAVPIHWGTFFPIGMSTVLPSAQALLAQPPLQFLEAVDDLNLGTEVVVVEPGSKFRVVQ